MALSGDRIAIDGRDAALRANLVGPGMLFQLFLQATTSGLQTL